MSLGLWAISCVSDTLDSTRVVTRSKVGCPEA